MTFITVFLPGYINQEHLFDNDPYAIKNMLLKFIKLSPCIRTNNNITNFILWLPYIIINVMNIINIGPLMTGFIFYLPIGISFFFILIFYLLFMIIILIFILLNVFIIAFLIDAIFGILTFG